MRLFVVPWTAWAGPAEEPAPAAAAAEEAAGPAWRVVATPHLHAAAGEVELHEAERLPGVEVEVLRALRQRAALLRVVGRADQGLALARDLLDHGLDEALARLALLPLGPPDTQRRAAELNFWMDHRIAAGDLEGACALYEADRLVLRRSALLRAECAWRAGDLATAAQLAQEVGASGVATAVERAWAAGIAATVRALTGDRRGAQAAVAALPDVAGTDSGWVELHRRWVRHRCDGVPLPPEPPHASLVFPALPAFYRALPPGP